MINLTSIKHHPALEEITDVLCAKTQNSDKGFYRVVVAFFLTKMASCMRAVIDTQDRGRIPVNCYVIDLGMSGLGKGYSISVLENDLMKGFKDTFVNITMPKIAEDSLTDLSSKRAIRNNTDQQDEFEKASKEYNDLGPYPFTFDSGTSPAVKQLRQKLLMAKAGAINFQCDEIGSNLVSNTEILNVFLELFDKGFTKIKLTKHTNESKRGEDLDGATPANMLLFGTPSKLFDGSVTEDAFYSFLEIGYARRCLFGIGHVDKKLYHIKTADEIFDLLINPVNKQIMFKWMNKFTSLAHVDKYNWTMTMDRNVSVQLIQYMIDCNKQADLLADHEEIKKAELTHRYFKALKLAGTFAFIDECSCINEEHLLQAIKLVEESGQAFQSILTREKSYMKLAKYIANIGEEVTHADLNEALPFYKSSTAARNEMMSMAMAWGYKHQIIIKRTRIDDIDFFSGEKLIPTDINNITFSVSTDIALGYTSMSKPFHDLYKMVTKPGFHWCNHSFKDGHRRNDNVIPGFNMIVLDVDGDISLANAWKLLKDYTFLTYTTKRNTAETNRFRILLPINFNLKLDIEDYKEFMNNIIEWIPFKVDEASNQISKKWLTNGNSQYHYNDGKLLDALMFIPRTSKNEQYKKENKTLGNLSKLERWFMKEIETGNRNNNLFKYAALLLDSGMKLSDVESNLKVFNKKLSNPLTEEEIDSSIMVTLKKKS